MVRRMRVSAVLLLALCVALCGSLASADGNGGRQGVREFNLDAGDAAGNAPPDVAALEEHAAGTASAGRKPSVADQQVEGREEVEEEEADDAPDGVAVVHDEAADAAVMSLAERRARIRLKKKPTAPELPTAAEELRRAKRAEAKAEAKKRRAKRAARAKAAKAAKLAAVHAERDAKALHERNEDGGYSPVAPALLRFDDDLRPLYRYWNPKLRDHVYKLNKRELGTDGKSGWRFQGVQCYIYNRNVTGSIPLYHYWNVERGDDFYTIDVRELGPEGKSGYVMKKILGWVPQIEVEGSVPLYRYYNHGIGDHFYTNNWSHLGTGKHGFVFQGIAANVFPDPSGSHPQVAGTGKEDGTPLEQRALLVPLYRYWNVHNRDHLYTTRWSEVQAGTHGWVYQGVQALVFARPMPGTVPLHRYWNIGTLDHFYTTNFSVLKHGGDGWKYEGVQCYVSPYRRADTVPLYRYFNTRINDHFYTTRFLGKDPNGWKFEGIQAYVHPRATDRQGTLPGGKAPDSALPKAKDGLVPLFRYWSPLIKDHFYTTNWSTLKNGVRGWKYDGIQAYVYTENRPETVPLRRFWNAHTGDHFYTVDDAEVRDDPKWVAQGTTAYVYKTFDHGGIPLYRYYNSVTGDHFYTTNWKELERGANGFEYQGVACYVVSHRDALPASQAPAQPGSVAAAAAAATAATAEDVGAAVEAVEGVPAGLPGSVPAPNLAILPIYQYSTAKTHTHMYSTSPLRPTNGFQYDGIAAYCHRDERTDRVPLLQYLNTRTGDLFLTVKRVGRRGDEWSYRGVLCYVDSQRVDGTVPLYEYWSEELVQHYYTTSWRELKQGASGFVYKGIAAYVLPPMKGGVTGLGALGTGAGGASPNPGVEEAAADAGSGVVPLRKLYSSSRKDHMIVTASGSPARGAYANDGVAGFVHSRPAKGAVPLYRYYNRVSRDHFYTTNWAALGKAGHSGWKYEGVQCYVYRNAERGRIPLYRYFDEAAGDHMLTTKYLGRQKGSFKLQGTTAYVLRAPPGNEGAGSGSMATKELFRYYNKATRDHFYTTRKEVLAGGREGWAYQDVAGRVFGWRVRGTVPLYVYFNTRVNDHYYTTDIGPLGKGGKYGWKYEGIEGYVYKRAGARGSVPLYQYYNEEVHDHFYTTNWSALRTGGSNGWKYNGVAAYILPKEDTRKSMA
jgi:hypothetical protein